MNSEEDIEMPPRGPGLVSAISVLKSRGAQWGALVDFSLPASQHRFFLYDLSSEEVVYSWYTSHGTGSGPRERATVFSNRPESRMSSLGLYKTAETYNSPKFGYALRLDGLSNDNSKTRERAIVLHRSAYVSKDYIKMNKIPGRSWGCITLDPDRATEIIDLLKGGSFIVVRGPK